MTISVYTCLLGGFLSFFSICFSAVNTKSMQYNRYWLIPPISYLKTFSEMFTAGIFVHAYIDKPMLDCAILAFCIGTGAWSGCVAGIHLQAILVKVLYKQPTKV